LQGYENNIFVQYLCGKFGDEVTRKAIERYFIGTSKDGGTVFWQIDLQGKVSAGKIIVYGTDGHRRKDTGLPVQWVHKTLSLPDFSLCQCLFGAHLLNDTAKTVCIVEAEKTAIIASCCLPKCIWLATGGNGQLNPKNEPQKFEVLKGRNVVLYPDASLPDKNGKTCFDKWSEKAKELSMICKVSVSCLVEEHATEAERKAGFDIADYFLKTQFKETIKQPESQQIQTPQPENKNVTEPITRQDKQIKDVVMPPKKETVNFEDEVLELEKFFSTATLPTEPVKLNSSETIGNVRFFVENHLVMLKAQSKNKAYLPYLHHLQELKNFLYDLKTT
jgi:hypothetical protein